VPEEQEAWESWVARQGPVALLYARSMTGSLADAEDALQEGFVRFFRFWNKGGQMRDRAKMLFACVRSALLDQRRGNLRRQRREELRGRDMPLFEESGEAQAARRELVNRALEELPEEQREVVVMKLWGGLTFAEIGEAVGVPANTAATRYRYALEKMGGMLLAPGGALS
jgi:RNA polymerase sigma-70 factor (ECF subfamily)